MTPPTDNDAGIEPWKIALAKAFATRTEKGRRGEPPTAEDLAAMFFDIELVEHLMVEVEDGPWHALMRQARAVIWNRDFGRLLLDSDIMDALKPMQK